MPKNPNARPTLPPRGGAGVRSLCALLALTSSGSAASLRMRAAPPAGSAAAAAATLSRTVAHIAASATAEQALRAAGLQVAEVEHITPLLGSDLRTALDLKLLGGGPEAKELIATMKTKSVSIGTRAKVRLLVGDQEHLARFEAAGSMFGHPAPRAPEEAGMSMWRRVQDEKGEEGMSMDTGVARPHAREVVPELLRARSKSASPRAQSRSCSR